MQTSDPLADWLEIGRIIAPQGLKGEMRVYPNSDFPERFEQPGQRWLLRVGATTPEPIELLSGYCLPGKGLYVIKLAGVADREQAEALRDARLMVPESDRPPLEEGEFHVIDLIGLTVFNQLSQTEIGTVVEVMAAGNDLLAVQLTETTADAESQPKIVLIPFVTEIVPIVDLTARRLEINPPPGLLEV